MDVLVSGASVAGPTVAYWLNRHGFRVTVVEKAPTLRKAGGHAVDLFASALDIVERMRLHEAAWGRRTGTEQLVVRRAGTRRPLRIETGPASWPTTPGVLDHRWTLGRGQAEAEVERRRVASIVKPYRSTPTISAVAVAGRPPWTRQ